MGTYDYTGDAVAGASPPNPFIGQAFRAPLYRRLKVSAIIADNAVMKAAGFIAINDIVQAIHVKAGYSLDACILRIITAGTATVTAEVGLAGGAEGIGSTPVAMDAAAGTMYRTIEADTWDLGKVFTTNDTIDVQFLIANCAVGDFELFVMGNQLLLGV